MDAMTVHLPIRHMVQDRLTVLAPRQGLFEITADVASWLDRQRGQAGLLTLFLRHTSASLVIQENVDPDVARDLEKFFHTRVPEDSSLYRHTAEGPDDMPAHIKGALTQTHLAIPVSDGRMLLGNYQGVFLFEHRRVPRTRELILNFSGEGPGHHS